MGTDNYFICNNCGKKGGNFERKMWGWGNANIIDSFQFIMKHTDLCGANNIGVVSEHEDYCYEKDTGENLNEYFPHSFDWDKKEWMEKYNKFVDTENYASFSGIAKRNKDINSLLTSYLSCLEKIKSMKNYSYEESKDSIQDLLPRLENAYKDVHSLLAYHAELILLLKEKCTNQEKEKNNDQEALFITR